MIAAAAGCEERADSKQLANLKAAFALAGFAVHETASGGFLVSRWNLSRECADMDALTAFARQVGAVKASHAG